MTVFWQFFHIFTLFLKDKNVGNEAQNNDAMKNVWNIGNQNEKKEKNPTKDDPFHQSFKQCDISQVWKL